jgi:GntR family transcriptional regulator
MLKRLHLQQDGVPIYVQLRDQLHQAIGDGTLAPGARLPTMREVSVALKVDLNTVQRAYAELERRGAITTLRGRGTFVAAVPPLGVDPREVGRAILRLSGETSAQ